MAENKATEKRAVDGLRQESEELKKAISDLNMQRDHMIQEVPIRVSLVNLNIFHLFKIEMSITSDILVYCCVTA